MKNLFERAEEFIWQNARLLERRLFDFHFRSGSSQAVLSALRAYQNKDGGYGNALEPDIRCPESQPVPTQHALEILDTTGFDEMMVRECANFFSALLQKKAVFHSCCLLFAIIRTHRGGIQKITREPH